MKLNVVYNAETGRVKRWSNTAPNLTEGEAVMITEKSLFGKTWTVDATTLEITEVIPGQTWGKTRMVRDALLAQTDYTTQVDFPMTGEKRAAVLAYRQALRDITETYKTPDEVVWPVNPLAR